MEQTSRLFFEPEERGSKVVIRRMLPHYTGNGEVIARRVELHDAKSIVRAVNAHDELVAALTEAAQALSDLSDRYMHNSTTGADVWQECGAKPLVVARAALAKAKGGAS